MVETLTGREMKSCSSQDRNKQIALKLGISAHTVKFHVFNLRKDGDHQPHWDVKLGLQRV
jgi:DNA-binding CsgD family transcriptional regulator